MGMEKEQHFAWEGGATKRPYGVFALFFSIDAARFVVRNRFYALRIN